MANKDEQIAQRAEQVRESAADLRRSASAVEESVDRNTVLSADRNVLAAERTYAAWVRTALAALVAGGGAKALLSGVLPGWWGTIIGSALVLFSIFCLVAGVWRELNPGPPPPYTDVRRIPTPLLIFVNGLLILVSLAVLGGIWAITI
jgi:putative membrane protein